MADHSQKDSSDITPLSPYFSKVEDRCLPGWQRLELTRFDSSVDFPSLSAEDLASTSNPVFTYMQKGGFAEFRAKTTVSEDTRRSLKSGAAHFVVEDLCGLRPDKGYWAHLPVVGTDASNYKRCHDTGDLYLPVNLYYFILGLRFPLHWFFQFLLVRYQVSLAQVTPTSVRSVLMWIFVCEWLNFPLTFSLFRSCFKLSKNPQMLGTFSFSPVNKTSFWYPKISDLRGHLEKWVLVRIPVSVGHPYRYLPPREFTVPVQHASWGAAAALRNLSKREVAAFRYFQRAAADKAWAPHGDYFRRDEVLCAVGMSPRFQFGKCLPGCSSSVNPYCSVLRVNFLLVLLFAEKVQSSVHWQDLGLTPHATYYRNDPNVLDKWKLTSVVTNILKIVENCTHRVPNIKARKEKSYYVDTAPLGGPSADPEEQRREEEEELEAALEEALQASSSSEGNKDAAGPLEDPASVPSSPVEYVDGEIPEEVLRESIALAEAAAARQAANRAVPLAFREPGSTPATAKEDKKGKGPMRGYQGLPTSVRVDPIKDDSTPEVPAVRKGLFDEVARQVLQQAKEAVARQRAEEAQQQAMESSPPQRAVETEWAWGGPEEGGQQEQQQQQHDQQHQQQQPDFIIRDAVPISVATPAGPEETMVLPEGKHSFLVSFDTPVLFFFLLLLNLLSGICRT